jgi:hypothetical protein
MSTTEIEIEEPEILEDARRKRDVVRAAARLWIAYVAIPYEAETADEQRRARREFNDFCRANGLTLGEATGHDVNADVFRQATYLMQSQLGQLRGALASIRTYTETKLVEIGGAK